MGAKISWHVPLICQPHTKEDLAYLNKQQAEFTKQSILLDTFQLFCMCYLLNFCTKFDGVDCTLSNFGCLGALFSILFPFFHIVTN